MPTGGPWTTDGLRSERLVRAGIEESSGCVSSGKSLNVPDLNILSCGIDFKLRNHLFHRLMGFK